MEIDYTIFWEWACEHFGEDNCYQSGEEVCINSPFVTDSGHHLWCNPNKGVYHCWKSNECGTIINLIMEREGCSFPEAQEILGGDRILHKLEEKIAAFFVKNKEIIVKKSSLELPPNTFKITSLATDNRLRKLATTYLSSRCIPIDGLYVCGLGKYADRIIIPYYDKDGNLIYFNGRDMTGKQKLRYRGPEKEVGIGKSEVIWMKEWPKDGTMIYLTEGEFDAMSLCQCGFNGAAIGGKQFFDKQLQLIKQYNLAICFDLDKYGLEALNKVGAFIRSMQFVRGAKNDKISFVKPAKGFKDWNDMLIKLNPAIIHEYVRATERVLDRDELIRLENQIST